MLAGELVDGGVEDGAQNGCVVGVEEEDVREVNWSLPPINSHKTLLESML